jgi:NTE family protein
VISKEQGQMPQPKIGLVLGSGSARGWSHIGIIEALSENGIKPDIVTGCSIGAMVGAACIADKIAPLKDWILKLNWREIAGLLSVGFSDGGLVDGDVFKQLMAKLGVSAPIESYATPFACVATDLSTGREVWLDKGPIHEAVRASMAMPGIFTPAMVGDRWLVDGGVVNPVPVSTCRALGAEIIIAANLNADIVERRVVSSVAGQGQNNQQAARPEILEGLLKRVPSSIRQSISQITPRLLASRPSAPGYFDVFASSINIMQDQITRSRLAGEPPHVMLMPRLGHMGLFDFHRAREAIAEGRACVDRAMPTLKALI